MTLGHLKLLWQEVYFQDTTYDRYQHRSVLLTFILYF